MASSRLVSARSRGVSDVMSDDDDAATRDDGFNPATDLDKLSDKERRAWNKNLLKWRTFIDFLFRHVSIVTFKYNCFEREEMISFMVALDKVEGLRAQMKLKKGEEPKITSMRVMSDSSELLVRSDFIMEANRIRKFLDLAGRMRGLGTVAFGFYKTMKKGKLSGLPLVTADPVILQKHMQAAEYVLAARIEEFLFEAGEHEILESSSTHQLLHGGQNGCSAKDKAWDLPPLEDVDPELLKPILDNSLLLELPTEPPKEKKSKKRGKKGAKGKKATSKKGKKKKK